MRRVALFTVLLSCFGDACADEPKPLRVAAVQLRSTRDRAANVAAIQQALRRAAKEGVRVVVFPECALTGYFAEVATATTADELAQAERQLAETCREASVYAVVGSPWREGRTLYNSALVIDPAGRVIERYHKVRLAESWPSPGDHLCVFPVDGIVCTVIICHDERYPELVRLPVLAGARVVFYISHESGVVQESKIGPYRAQIQARAVENTVWVVHANAPANLDSTGSHGQSRVVAPDGNVVKEAGVYTEETLVADLDPRRATAANAARSLAPGPLADWWRDGVKRVRVIDPPSTRAPDRAQ